MLLANQIVGLQIEYKPRGVTLQQTPATVAIIIGVLPTAKPEDPLRFLVENRDHTITEVSMADYDIKTSQAPGIAVAQANVQVGPQGKRR